MGCVGARDSHTLVSVNDTSVLLFGGKDYTYTFDDVRLISPGAALLQNVYRVSHVC